MSDTATQLTDKERLWIEHYLQCWNASEAARRAGYKDPGQAGYENKKKQEIRDEIERRLDAYAMTANEVLARLSEQAQSDMSDFLTPSGRGVRLDINKALKAGKGYLIKKYTKDKNGFSIELHDAQAALVHIGKSHGIFKEQSDAILKHLDMDKLTQNQLRALANGDDIITVLLNP